VPYTISKHALDALTKDFASRNPFIKTNHYCMPTMDTPQYSKVTDLFKDIKKEFNLSQIADPKIIAKALVSHCLEYKETAKTLVIDASGVVKELSNFRLSTCP